MMKCPKCRGEMVPITTKEGVEVDFCTGCKGTFFDAGEVAAYFELSRDCPELGPTHATASETNLGCPKCFGAMTEVRYHDSSDLVVDRCIQCGGIYLDKGEIPKLHALSALIEDPKTRLWKVISDIKKEGYEVMGVNRA